MLMNLKVFPISLKKRTVPKLVQIDQLLVQRNREVFQPVIKPPDLLEVLRDTISSRDKNYEIRKK